MGKTRTIAKSCPKCDLQVAVASKTCKCGYTFFTSRRVIRGPSPEIDERLRRTGRIRREKPKFYDSQQFDKKKKRQQRVKRCKQLSDTETSPVQQQQEEQPQQPAKLVQVKKETTAIRAKRRQRRKEEEDGGGDLLSRLPKEKQELASIILSDINNKIGSVYWKA